MKTSYKNISLVAAFIASASAQFAIVDDGAGGEAPDVTNPIDLGDPQAKVAQVVSFATLDCPTLALVKDASTLDIPISATEVLTFASTFYDTKDGSHFDDDIGREVWAGVGPQGDDETAPAIITMAWAADPCVAETFSLKITSFKNDGNTVVIRSIPCNPGSNIDTCLVTLTYAKFLDESDGLEVDVTTDPPISSTDLGNSRRNLRSTSRNLQADASEPASVDVMYLYTEAVLTQLGGISPGQMFSIIYASVASTNDAFANSLIPLTFNLAYVGLFPGTEDPSSASKTLMSLPLNGEVAGLRETYQADLVQLLGAFTTSCSAAYNYAGKALYGFSVVNPSCLDNRSHSHAFGHNLGCYLNRENTSVDKPYEHGYRTCDSQLPFSTIMSIKCSSGQAPRINFYSNPEATWRGLPTGTATENCAQGIIDNMSVVEKYQPVVIGPTPSPTDASTPAPTAARTPSPTGASTPAPTAARTPSPTDASTPAPTAARTPSPTDASTPAPTAARTPSPTDASTPAPTAARTPAPTEAPTPGYVSLGCWVDSGSNRVLSGSALLARPDMTTEMCAEKCVGSTYFGTEFGGECFCGLSTDDPAKLGESSRCIMACTGDAGEICGGANAINIYKYADYSFEGCFVDRVNSRVLNAAAKFDGAMSTDFCAEFCAGHPYFGTEYGIECFCGSDSDDPSEYGSSSHCDFVCPGALAEKCGGSNAISVYRPTKRVIVDGPTELGCYTDSPTDRLFERVVVDDALTPEGCESTCAGYKYFGLQYRNECWCGDNNNFARHGKIEICDLPCAGDANTICGGGYAMNVYEY